MTLDEEKQVNADVELEFGIKHWREGFPSAEAARDFIESMSTPDAPLGYDYHDPRYPPVPERV